MNNFSVNLIQIILILMITLINICLQAYALYTIKSIDNDQVNLKKVHETLLLSLIIQFISFVVMIFMIVFIVYYKDSTKSFISLLTYIGIFITSTIMFFGGAINAFVANKLQCYRADKNINIVWQMSTINAISGILGTMLVLIIQAFIKRDYLKTQALNYLQNNKANMPENIASNIPIYNPPLF